MELLTIAGVKGSQILIRVDGSDEDQAIDTLVSLVRNGFGEQE
jgi:phosphotransferase system HPr-like phosphotransfer protein